MSKERIISSIKRQVANISVSEKELIRLNKVLELEKRIEALEEEAKVNGQNN